MPWVILVRKAKGCGTKKKKNVINNCTTQNITNATYYVGRKHDDTTDYLTCPHIF